MKKVWSLRVILIICIVSLAPTVFSVAGFTFKSISRGGPGAHYAGWVTDTHLTRFDINALGLMLLFVTLTIIYNNLRPSRFVYLLGFTMVIAVMVDAIQIVPNLSFLGDKHSYQTTTVWTSLVNRAGSAAILFCGALSLMIGQRTQSVLLVYANTLLAIILGTTTWTICALGRPAVQFTPAALHLVTYSLYLATTLVLFLQLRKRSTTLLGQLLIAAIIPLVAGQMWLSGTVTSYHDQGFHISVMLKWLSWLLVTSGLGIDLINTFHSQGLNKEKLFLRSVIDAIPHYIFARDDRGYFTLVNRSVANFYDRDVSEVEGHHLSEIHEDEDQCREWITEDKEVLRDGERVDIPETVTTNADGQDIWITAIKKPLPTAQNSQDQVLGVTIDITRQKKAECALAERLKFEQAAAAIMQAFVHSTNDNLGSTMDRVLQHLGFYTEADRCFLYRFNETEQAAGLIFSWVNENTRIERDLPRLLPSEGRNWMSRWFDINMPVSVGRLMDLSGEAAGFLDLWQVDENTAFLAVPLVQNNQVKGFLGIDALNKHSWTREETNLVRYVADHFITVWSKLEAENDLVQAMNEARASSQAKSEFLANMSHEIRTPMNCVIGISDLLMEMEPTDHQRQYLDMISQSGNALLVLINDILDLSKIEAGRLELDLVEMDLRKLVEDVTGLTAFNTQAKGVEMISRIAPGVPETVVCDPNRLRQVLTNLLNNAAKFTTSGHLYLNVEPTGESDGLLNLRFQVTDTGIGIASEKLQTIFDKFTQADASTTRKFGGTGLGLPISQHLVGLMGGQISARSQPGQGSTFEFTLPLEVKPSAVDQGEAMPEHREPVLVVSGLGLSGEVLAEQVRSLGFPCSVAIGCDDAMDLLPGPPEPGQSNWSFILLDQDLVQKEDTGLQPCLEELKAMVDSPIIMLTALSSTLREQDWMQQGFSGILPKPVRPHQLKSVLIGKSNTASKATEPVAGPAVATGDEISGPLILLAEDNPFNQKVALSMLKLLGCRVEVANNGAEAVAAVQSKTYDLVFMDCQMPEMDGYEATRAIRALDNRDQAATTIVAMTANALSGDKRACFNAGMDDFLSKPINKAMLSDMLSKWELVNTPV